MGNNLTEHGRKLAEMKAQKRAAALRENLKRRKAQNDAAKDKGEQNAKSENRE